MSNESERVRPGAADLDPRMIREMRVAGWVLAVASVIGVAWYSAVAGRVPSPTWVLYPGGRSSAADVAQFATADLLTASCVTAALIVVSAAALQWLVRRHRAWPLLIALIVVVFGASYLAVLLSGAAAQLDTSGAWSHDVALARLQASGTPAIALVFFIVLIGLVIIPGVRSRSRAAAADR